jgi:hypothetical protein
MTVVGSTEYGIVRHEDGSVSQEVTFEGNTVPDRLKLLKALQTLALMY